MTQPTSTACSDHGTIRSYRKGCHCGACRWAAARDEKQRLYDAAHGRPRAMPALGVQRRIQALACLGWPLNVLNEMAGYHANASPLRRAFDGKSRYVFRGTHERVAMLYDRLCMTPRIPANGYEAGHIARTKARAAASGWAPPLAWSNIDDPDEQPQAAPPGFELVDQVVVERILSRNVVRATPAERLATIARWQQLGRSLKDLEGFTGWNVHRDLGHAANRTPQPSGVG